MKIRLFFKPFDLIPLVLALLVTVSFSVYAYGYRSEGGDLVIETADEQWIYPLDDDRTVEIEGPIGVTVIKIDEGTAWVVSSPCRDKICTASAPILNTGQWIACMPNQVFLRIESTDNAEVDATTF
jgi:hypothetical protein